LVGLACPWISGGVDLKLAFNIIARDVYADRLASNEE